MEKHPKEPLLSFPFLPFLRPDGKELITAVYEDATPLFVKDVIVFCQHDPEIALDKLRDFLVEEAVKRVIPQNLLQKDTKILLNSYPFL